MTTHRAIQFIVLILVAGITCPLACNSSPAQSNQSAASSTGDAQSAAPEAGAPIKASSTTAPSLSWSDKKNGIGISWLPGFHRENHPDYECNLVPDDAGAKDKAWVSLDIPDLPAIAKFVGIPLGKVKNGYIDDLKEKEPNLTVDEDAPFTVPGAKAQRVRCSWTREGVNWSQTAVCIVHDSSVFIIRGHSDQAHEAMMKKQFDAVVSSIKWIK